MGFEIGQYRDNKGRTYNTVSLKGTPEETPVPVYMLMPVLNGDLYLKYSLASMKDQVDGMYATDNSSTDGSLETLKQFGVNIINVTEKGDISKTVNKGLEQIPANSWVFWLDQDDVLFDLPPKFLGRLAAFLQKNGAYTLDVRYIDFIYNYGTTFCAWDWGDGPGNYWSARKLFYWTGKEKFVNPVHFNISNMVGFEGEIPFNNEHTGEWNGVVPKTHLIQLFNYGKTRGIERERQKPYVGMINPDDFALGRIPTKPYTGPHPKVMGLGEV